MCKQSLPIDNFEIATKDGYRRGQCKTCVSINRFVKRKPERTEDDYWKWQNEIKEKEKLLKEKEKLFNEGKKKCARCGEIKLITEFNKSGSNRYQSRCRVCTKAEFKIWRKKKYLEVRERERKRKWDKRTPEQKEKYLAEKAYREELHSLQKEGKRRCRMCNEVKILDEFHSDSSRKVFYNKKSYCKSCAYKTWRRPYDQLPENRARKSIHDKKYRSNPKVKQRINKQYFEKYHNDPVHKIKVLMRGRLNKVLDRKKQSKRFTQELGCTFDELVVHLESQFYPDPRTGEMMTWDNHSTKGWHIDHIKPLHEFDLYDDEQFKQASHYTNLQPLWWWQNLAKNRKDENQ